MVLAVNKVDRVKDRAKLAQLLAACAARRDFAALVPVSAEKGTQVTALVDEVAQAAARGRARLRRPTRSPTAPSASSPPSSCARSSSASWATSCPYTAAVVIEEFKEEGALRRIQATIYVDRQGHKAIVIGEKGATLKRIGTEARVAMEALFGGKVFLELWVKVKSGWADSEAMVRQWGYE